MSLTYYAFWGTGFGDEPGEYQKVKKALFEDIPNEEFSVIDHGTHFWVGLSWSAIKDDETGAEFKERARKMIKKYTGIEPKFMYEYLYAN